MKFKILWFAIISVVESFTNETYQVRKRSIRRIGRPRNKWVETVLQHAWTTSGHQENFTNTPEQITEIVSLANQGEPPFFWKRTLTTVSFDDTPVFIEPPVPNYYNREIQYSETRRRNSRNIELPPVPLFNQHPWQRRLVELRDRRLNVDLRETNFMFSHFLNTVSLH